MSLKTFLLLLLIAVLGTFIYLKVQSLGSETSYFNQHTRYRLGKYALMRAVLALRKDGDARAEYLLNTGPLTIEVVEAEGADIDAEALERFSQKVAEYTGRTTSVVNVDTVKAGRLTAQDLGEIVRRNRRHRPAGGSNLFVVYAQDFGSAGSEVGRTFEDFGMVLSHARLTELTSNSPAARGQYVESTLLHEFGHQIGLPHSTDPNCIMNEAVESPKGAAGFSGFYTPTAFCAAEAETLSSIKAELQ